MSRIELAPQVLDDFERIRDHLLDHDSPNSAARINQIMGTVDVLADNPLIGRALNNGLRELVIGQGGRGYIALYKYLDALDVVLLLAIRSQREAGYASAD